MIQVVNQQGLCWKVLNFILQPENDRALLVWCQYGTFCAENVRDAVSAHKRSGDRIRIAENDDEEADIAGFISEAVGKRQKGEKLIIISFLPWGRENADALMGEYEGSIESVRYQADAEEWLNLNFTVSNITRPLVGFLKKYPEFFVLPYGEKPLPNKVGPCPASWADVDAMWSDQYYRSFYQWGKMRPSEKVNTMLLFVRLCIGGYEPMMTRLRRYLLFHRGYNHLLLPPPPEVGSRPETTSNFTEIFK